MSSSECKALQGKDMDKAFDSAYEEPKFGDFIDYKNFRSKVFDLKSVHYLENEDISSKFNLGHSTKIPKDVVFFLRNYSDLPEKWIVRSGCAKVFFGKNKIIYRKKAEKFSYIQDSIFIVQPRTSFILESILDIDLEVVRLLKNSYVDELLYDAIVLGEGNNPPLAPKPVLPNELSDSDLAAHVLEVVGQLLKGRAGARSIVEASFNKAATPEVTSLPEPLFIPLPDKAPRLWEDRPDDERKMNPTEFIRKVYGAWLGHGLARHHIGELDRVLGKRYSSWIQKGRHPEDAITEFDGGNPYGKLDDAEAGRRHRESVKASHAKKSAKMSQPTGMGN